MADVTVCVPVYNAAAFLAETLDSIVTQTLSDVRILVSIDRGSDQSEAICRRYVGDPRVSVVVQSDRLGWVGNVNALIARVETAYFCIVPHDDRLHPDYLARTHDLVASDLAIGCAYSDIQGFGASRPLIEQPEIRGDRLTRVLEFLLNHSAAVAFRGVVRRRGPADRPLIPTGLPGDVAADTVWMAGLAVRGELRRVAAPLYEKRYQPSSVHASWARYSADERSALWGEQAVACARVVLGAVSDPIERDLVRVAARLRARGIGEALSRMAWSLGPRAEERALAVVERAADLRLTTAAAVVLERPQAEPLRSALARARADAAATGWLGRLRRLSSIVRHRAVSS